jgi:hypothetical protein
MAELDWETLTHRVWIFQQRRKLLVSESLRWLKAIKSVCDWWYMSPTGVTLELSSEAKVWGTRRNLMGSGLEVKKHMSVEDKRRGRWAGSPPEKKATKEPASGSPGMEDPCRFWGTVTQSGCCLESPELGSHSKQCLHLE